MNSCDEHSRDVLLYLGRRLRGQELEDFLAILQAAQFRNQAIWKYEHRSRRVHHLFFRQDNNPSMLGIQVFDAASIAENNSLPFF
jgi:hypothetical protein